MRQGRGSGKRHERRGSVIGEKIDVRMRCRRKQLHGDWYSWRYRPHRNHIDRRMNVRAECRIVRGWAYRVIRDKTAPWPAAARERADEDERRVPRMDRSELLNQRRGKVKDARSEARGDERLRRMGRSEILNQRRDEVKDTRGTRRSEIKNQSATRSLLRTAVVSRTERLNGENLARSIPLLPTRRS